MSEILKIGIVGLGKMGQTRAHTIATNPATELIAGADPSASCREKFQGIALSHDFRDVIAGDADAVFVCTPNKFTPDVVISALDAGKHVFCEKPPGRTVRDIENIIEAERRNPGLKLKFSPLVEALSGVPA